MWLVRAGYCFMKGALEQIAAGCYIPGWNTGPATKTIRTVTKNATSGTGCGTRYNCLRLKEEETKSLPQRRLLESFRLLLSLFWWCFFNRFISLPEEIPRCTDRSQTSSGKYSYLKKRAAVFSKQWDGDDEHEPERHYQLLPEVSL